VLPLVDAHVHFYDLDDTAGGLQWAWMDPAHADGLTHELAIVGTRRFTPPDLWAEGKRAAHLIKCVHVQAASGAHSSLAETRWLTSLQQAHGAPHAAIARVELDQPGADAELAAQVEYPLVRGVRDMGKGRLLGDDAYRRGVALLGTLGLIFEVFCSPRRFATLGALAARCPDTQIVLEHFGLPADDVAGWRDGLLALAHHENVAIKLSGLALSDSGWTYDYAAELVDACLDAFRPDRCLLGSNWPIDRAYAAYPDAFLAVEAATRALSADERRAIFSGTAERIYAI
jgi:predicted TIM-barrel fold metal-dependent hydrolase